MSVASEVGVPNEAAAPSDRPMKRWEVVLYSTLAAVGIFLIATGAAKWREIAFTKETRWSKSPLPYHMNLSRQLRLVGAHADSRWLLVVAPGTELGMICQPLTAGALATLAGSGSLQTVRLSLNARPQTPTTC